MKHDQPENEAWAGWHGIRLSPRRIVGESLGASAALQCVIAIAMLRSGDCSKAIVTSVGGNEQAAGAVFAI
jgi:hypothetical protein